MYNSNSGESYMGDMYQEEMQQYDSYYQMPMNPKRQPQHSEQMPLASSQSQPYYMNNQQPQPQPQPQPHTQMFQQKYQYQFPSYRQLQQQQQQHLYAQQRQNQIIKPLQKTPFQEPDQTNISKVLFSGGSPLPDVDLENITRYQDTPPSSPDSVVSTQLPFYSSYQMSGRQYAKQYKEVPKYNNNVNNSMNNNSFGKWNINKVENFININIDGSLPNLDPIDVDQSINMNDYLAYERYQQLLYSNQGYIPNHHYQQQDSISSNYQDSMATSYRKHNYEVRSEEQQSLTVDISNIKQETYKTNEFELGNLSPISTVSTDSFHNLQTPRQNNNDNNLTLPNQSPLEDTKSMGDSKSFAEEDNPLNFPEHNPSFLKEDEDSNASQEFSPQQHQIKVENISDTESIAEENKSNFLHKPIKGAINNKVKKQGKPGKPRLFKFLWETLIDKNECIEWVDESTGTFKFLDSKRIAHLWGLRKNKPNMQYENFARSLRTYIKKGILTKPRNKLVYRFAKLPDEDIKASK